eukprot:COSAG01_NODE_18018_length_1105_cov_1.360835_2_plen_34_part_01
MDTISGVHDGLVADEWEHTIREQGKWYVYKKCCI